MPISEDKIEKLVALNVEVLAGDLDQNDVIVKQTRTRVRDNIIAKSIDNKTFEEMKSNIEKLIVIKKENYAGFDADKPFLESTTYGDVWKLTQTAILNIMSSPEMTEDFGKHFMENLNNMKSEKPQEHDKVMKMIDTIKTGILNENQTG